MKKTALLLVLLASSFVFMGLAHAQVNLDVTAGYLIPTGDFADVSKPGFGIAGDVFAGLPMLPVEVGGRVSYSRFGAEDDFEDGNTSFIEISPSVRYVVGPPLSPVKVFGQLGVGLYNWNNEFEFKGLKDKLEDDGTDFGISVGAGVKAKLGPLTGLIAMPMYHVIFTEDENTTYISLNAGIVF